jgi:hypothetical protein
LLTKATRTLAVSLFCVLSLPFLARATEEKEKYPDGSIHFRIALDSKGRRQGTYTAYFPGGKKLQERAEYATGQLNGIRELYDDTGAQTGEEAWVAGRLVFPRSPRLIEANRARVMQEAQAYVAKMSPPTNPQAPSADRLARALGRLRAYRYVCNVPEDVTYDDGYINLCTYAGHLLDRVGQLSHDPPHPAGVDDESFKLGHEGCGRSNLFSSADIVASVDAYMDDSDSGNIDRIGHRRWVLNPAMGKTGFGAGSHFSAMYSFDNSRKDVPDYDHVSFPASGYTPHDMFRASYAWHVTVNPDHYGEISNDVKAAIYPTDLSLKRADQPLELDYFKINRDGFGVPNAIIFRPKGFVVRPEVLYEVVITGLKTKDGKAADLSYFVCFY